MARLCVALILIAASVVPATAEDVSAALVGATVIDGGGGPPITDGVVILRGDRIEAVGARGAVKLPARTKVIDVSGKWITPGLIDAHVHFFQSGGLYTRPDVIDLRKAVPYDKELDHTKARLDDTFARYLASGVTAVVDMGGPMWNFAVRARAAASERAPRVAVAGPLIATEPTPRQQRLNLGDPPIITAGDADAAAALARAQLPSKPDLIKIWAVGSGVPGAARTRAITGAVAAVAHGAGIRVAVHATDLLIAKAALDGGADILVHSIDDAPVDADFIAKVRARGAIYVTTAIVQEGYGDAFLGRPELSGAEWRLGAPDIIASLHETPARIVAANTDAPVATRIPQIQDNAKAMVAAGVRVAAGTDAGNIGTLHGPAIHRELALLVAGGLTASQALTAATRDAAYVFTPMPDFGLVRAGYRADLLVLAADPLSDIANLARIDQVWSRGRRFDPATLVAPSPASVVQTQLDAYNAHSLDAFAATYADDIQIFGSPGAANPLMDGIAALRKTYGETFARSPDLHCRIVQRSVEGDTVIDAEICTTKRDGPPVQAAAIYQVSNGRIHRVWFAAAE